MIATFTEVPSIFLYLLGIVNLEGKAEIEETCESIRQVLWFKERNLVSMENKFEEPNSKINCL